MPCEPVFSGPLPPALLANSLRAFSSVRHCVSIPSAPSIARGGVGDIRRTGALLLEEGLVVLIELLGNLLRGLQRLGLAAWRRGVSEDRGGGFMAGLGACLTISVGTTHGESVR